MTAKTKRCKHKNGIFIECMDATHTRDISDGKMDHEGINDIGNITHYEFICSDCRKNFKWEYSYSAPKWAQKYFDGL